MTDEKPPKHKPQHKHTLSEVLKSLQDLIRTDLIPAPPEPPPPVVDEGTRPDAPAANEADTFNQALDRLDRIITEQIIEPVERTRTEPPEPLLPDETLEIEWDDALNEDEDVAAPEAEPVAEISSTDMSPADETIELQPLPEDSASSTDSEIELASLADIESAAADREEATLSLESLEQQLTPAPAPPENELGQRTFDFADVSPESFTLTPPVAESPPAPEPTIEPTVGPTIEVEPPAPVELAADSEIVILADTVDAGSTEIPAAPPEPAGDTAAAPPGISEQRRETTDEPPPASAPSAFTVEYTPEREAPGAAGALQRPAAVAAGTDPASPVAEDDTVNPAAKTTGSKPERRPRERDLAAGERAAPEADPGRPEAPTGGEPPSTEDIPILEDIADLDAPPAPPLPDASQARDIAIRAIARLNIERRKAGEPPLDIKTIERLQQYLAEALTKRALSKPK